jgi:putative component of membrane protein insertase Oxa1/YidC/SpoIIIJ protein YidD
MKVARFIFILFCFNASMLVSQSNTGLNINQKIIEKSFDDMDRNVVKKRKILAFKKKHSQLNPLNYIGAGLLYVYQNIFSEQIQAECAYEVSCSEYTKLSIQQRGFLIGTLSGFNQLSECFPGAKFEHPPAFVNYSNQKIINSSEKEIK